MENVIAQTERLRLVEMQDADREDVLRLSMQTAFATENESMIETVRDVTWKAICHDTFNCIIRDRDGTFIGRVCMKHLSEEIPEVGIELLEQYRRQGIGPESLKAFVNWFKRTHKKLTVLVRIEQSNEHSRHVFEKIGAVYITNESMLQEEDIQRIKRILPDEDLSAFEIENIMVYRL